MIRDIVVNISLAPNRDVATDFAVSMGRAYEAHVAGVAFQYDPLIALVAMDGIPADIIESQRLESEQAAKAAAARFEDVARGAAVSADSRIVDATVGVAASRFARIARRFDLSVIGQADPDRTGPEDLIIEGALFESGRPVLIVPYIQKAGLKVDRIMLCWDGSRNAARATADAMPFFKRSKLVEVFVVDSGRLKSDELPGADIAQHLARHGLNVRVTRTVAGDIDIASTILAHVADSGADFLVMGGYGHSRLREFVLGGATRGILTSMTVPTLMSH
jgi:nucleotide-binding universal stress UspA family protein